MTFLGSPSILIISCDLDDATPTCDSFPRLRTSAVIPIPARSVFQICGVLRSSVGKCSRCIFLFCSIIATAVVVSLFSPVFANSTNAFRNLAVATRGSSTTFFDSDSDSDSSRLSSLFTAICVGMGAATGAGACAGTGSTPANTYILFAELYEISSNDFVEEIDLPPYHRTIFPMGATPISASVFLTLCNCSVSLTISFIGVPTIELSGWATSNITDTFLDTGTVAAALPPLPPITDPIAFTIVFINPLLSAIPAPSLLGVGIAINRLRNSVLSIFAGNTVSIIPFAGFAAIFRSGLSFFIIHSNTRRPPSSFISAGLIWSSEIKSSCVHPSRFLYFVTRTASSKPPRDV